MSPPTARLRAPAVAALAFASLVAAGAARAAGAAQEPDCGARLEHESRWQTLSVRGEDGCELDVEALSALVERGPWPDPTSSSRLESLFLGRLVRYPELGAAVRAAAQDAPAWNRERPPAPGEANRWVGATLASSPLLVPLRRALAERGLELAGVACEKVLVTTGHPAEPEWARGRRGLPYDAMCWIRLAPR